jgi:hypothetical protein
MAPPVLLRSAINKTQPASEEKGGSMQGAASVSEGIWMYQLTDKGIALEITRQRPELKWN